jgi:dTDP-4-dehydrorhamnose 3,5-epimerase
MIVERLALPEVLKITPKVFGDDRGFFFESFNERAFREATGVTVALVQDNHSRSARGVLRGVHYQLPPHAQGKLVRVVHGEVFDVAVDLRRSSPTFGRWAGAVLSAENKAQLWVPPGFGHGFVTLSTTAEFLYKTTDYYAPQYERVLRWDDPTVAIDWHFAESPTLAARDRDAPHLQQAEVFD